MFGHRLVEGWGLRSVGSAPAPGAANDALVVGRVRGGCKTCGRCRAPEGCREGAATSARGACGPRGGGGRCAKMAPEGQEMGENPPGRAKTPLFWPDGRRVGADEQPVGTHG